MINNYDIMIIGGGPAGITSSIYAAYDGRSAKIIEEKNICWIPEAHINLLGKMEGFPGMVNTVNGTDMVARFRSSLKEMAIKPIENLKVKNVIKTKTGFEAELQNKKNKLKSRVVILCTGTTPLELGLENEGNFAQTNLHYFAYEQFSLYRGKKVVVVGSRNSGATAAIYLAKNGVKVTVIEIKNEIQAKEKHKNLFKSLGISTITGANITKLIGKKRLESVEYIKDMNTNRIDIDGMFVYIGVKPNNKLAMNLGVKLNEAGYVDVNIKQETNIPGVYAAGDVTGGLKHVVVACGEWAQASYSANSYIG